jgi:hypothetical protein
MEMAYLQKEDCIVIGTVHFVPSFVLHRWQDRHGDGDLCAALAFEDWQLREGIPMCRICVTTLTGPARIPMCHNCFWSLTVSGTLEDWQRAARDPLCRIYFWSLTVCGTESYVPHLLLKIDSVRQGTLCATFASESWQGRQGDLCAAVVFEDWHCTARISMCRIGFCKRQCVARLILYLFASGARQCTGRLTLCRIHMWRLSVSSTDPYMCLNCFWRFTSWQYRSL